MAGRSKRVRNKVGRKRRTTRSTRGRERRQGEKSGEDLIKRADVVAFVHEQAARIAAPDLHALVADAELLRAKAAAAQDARFNIFRQQVDGALSCLEDYAAGRCPQIPYYTVVVLAAALFYFQTTVDVLPDFLPRLGTIDDALVMAVATELAADGLRRYQTWKATFS